jgi:hypothetical protein
MRKILLTSLCLLSFLGFVAAQDGEKEQEKKPFKEHLFTGGSVSLSYYNHFFLAGINPVFGYSIGKWVDAGIAVNYTYSSYKNFNYLDDLHQSVYGGGVFTKLYPIRSIFLQGQFEHNYIHQKYLYANGNPAEKLTVQANSFLVGAGYTTGRFPDEGKPFFYVAILVDILKKPNSPYVNYETDQYGNYVRDQYGNPIPEIMPIIRTGVQIPLFQGKNNNDGNERGNGRKRARERW